MRNRIVLLLALVTASVYAQTTDFFDLVSTGSARQVQAAIKAGASVNAQADNGMTPLMAAASVNTDPDVIAVLLKAGAKVNARDKNGDTPLMDACMIQTPDVIALLLKAGADATVKDDNGQTAFDFAKDNPGLQGTDAYGRLRAAAK